MARGVVTYTVTFSPSEAKRLKAIAREIGLTPETLVGELIERGLDAQELPHFRGFSEAGTAFDHGHEWNQATWSYDTPRPAVRVSVADPARADAPAPALQSRRELAQIALAEFDRTGVAQPLDEVLADARADLERRLAEKA